MHLFRLLYSENSNNFEKKSIIQNNNHQLKQLSFGIAIDFNDMHLRKQYFPMEVTELGIITGESDKQPRESNFQWK
jgi:hypothetical protein